MRLVCFLLLFTSLFCGLIGVGFFFCNSVRCLRVQNAKAPPQMPQMIFTDRFSSFLFFFLIFPVDRSSFSFVFNGRNPEYECVNVLRAYFAIVTVTWNCAANRTIYPTAISGGPRFILWRSPRRRNRTPISIETVGKSSPPPTGLVL